MMKRRTIPVALLVVAAAASIAAAPPPSELPPSLGRPQEVVVDSSGGVFLVDRGSIAVLAIDPATGQRRIVSDAMHGGGPALPHDSPSATDRLTAGALGPGGSVIVAGTVSLHGVDLATGGRTIVSMPGVRGSGPDLAAIDGIALETSGSLVVTDAYREVVRVDVGTGDRALLSGCRGSPCVPVGAGPMFEGPTSVAVGPSGTIFVADATGLIGVDASSGDRTLLSGPTMGSGPALPRPTALAMGPPGTILWAHALGILRIDAVTGDRADLSGPGTGGGPAFRAIEGIASDGAGTLLAADADLGAVVRVDPATGDRTILAGGPIGTGLRMDCLDDVASEASGALVVTTCDNGVLRVDPATGDRTVVSGPTAGSGPALDFAGDILVEPSGSLLVADRFSLKRVDPVTGARTIAAGRGHGGPFLYLAGTAAEAPGKVIAADQGVGIALLGGFLGLELFSAVKRVDLTTGTSEVVSGGGPGSGKRGAGIPFLSPLIGVAVESSGDVVAVMHPNFLLRIDARTGDRRIVCSDRVGSGAPVKGLTHVVVEPAGTWLTVDNPGNQIVRVDPATGVRTVVSGLSAGSGPMFEYPRALRIAPDGSLIVLNNGDHLTLPAFPFTVVMRVDLATGDRTILSRY